MPQPPVCFHRKKLPKDREIGIQGTIPPKEEGRGRPIAVEQGGRNGTIAVEAEGRRRLIALEVGGRRTLTQWLWNEGRDDKIDSCRRGIRKGTITCKEHI